MASINLRFRSALGRDNSPTVMENARTVRPFLIHLDGTGIMTLNLSVRSWMKYPNMVLLGGIAIGLLGPFGQIDRFLPVERIGLWVAYLAIGLPILCFTRHRINRALGAPLWLFSGLLTSMTVCLPLLLWVEFLGLIQGRALPTSVWDWIWSAGEVWLVAFVFLAAIEVCSKQFDNAQREPLGRSPTQAIDKTMKDFVGAHAGSIYAFCAEGHYTRIYGQNGDQFIHHSFSDMLRASFSLEGAQVHRSWWVAKDAAVNFRRAGSAGEITLINGLRVPVARRRLRDVSVLAILPL